MQSKKIMTLGEKLVYLGGPVRGVQPEVAQVWRSKLSTSLHRYNLASFNPAAAWVNLQSQASPIEDTIKLVNDLVLSNCDLMVAAYQGGWSQGTAIEANQCLYWNIPVFFLDLRITKRWEDFDRWIDQVRNMECRNYLNANPDKVREGLKVGFTKDRLANHMPHSMANNVHSSYASLAATIYEYLGDIDD